MKLAILGATGAVGKEVLGCLQQLTIAVDELILLASSRSAGQTLATPFGSLQVQEVNKEAFNGITHAIFSAGAERSREWAPIANKKGCVVIDNSSAFRYDDDVPLVIPEINGTKAHGAKLIANPNCTTAIAAMALYPIYKEFGIKKAFISTYQSASGAGAAAMQELLDETRHYLDGEEVGHEQFVHPIAFNVIPHIDAFQENGYTKEEMKVVWELGKIFDDQKMHISCTAVRIPVLRSHSETIVVETEKPVDVEEVRTILSDAPGVEVRDDPEKGVYPMPLTASRKYDIEVGRIRKNLIFGNNGLEFFVSGDQLLKGAALNAVQILQTISS